MLSPPPSSHRTPTKPRSVREVGRAARVHLVAVATEWARVAHMCASQLRVLSLRLMCASKGCPGDVLGRAASARRADRGSIPENTSHSQRLMHLRARGRPKWAPRAKSGPQGPLRTTRHGRNSWSGIGTRMEEAEPLPAEWRPSGRRASRSCFCCAASPSIKDLNLFCFLCSINLGLTLVLG